MRKIDEIRESFERGDNMFVLINARLLIELAELILKSETIDFTGCDDDDFERFLEIVDQLEAEV